MSLGVIENVHYRLKDPNLILSIVGKRTVYTKSEIDEMIKRPVTIILFNYHFHFEKSIKYKMLKDQKILKGPPQSIMEIDNDKYLYIKKQSGINERFTFN